jgi:hypothetical protein
MRRWERSPSRSRREDTSISLIVGYYSISAPPLQRAPVLLHSPRDEVPKWFARSRVPFQGHVAERPQFRAYSLNVLAYEWDERAGLAKTPRTKSLGRAANGPAKWEAPPYCPQINGRDAARCPSLGVSWDLLAKKWRAAGPCVMASVCCRAGDCCMPCPQVTTSFRTRPEHGQRRLWACWPVYRRCIMRK